MKRVLLCRTDRLGDVLLSLPSVLGLKSLYPQWQIDFLIAEPLVDLLRPLLRQQGVGVVSYTASSKKWWNQVTEARYDAAINFYHDVTLAKSLKALRLPLRIGVYSKLSSVLFYNAGRVQRRSRGVRSESAYTSELVDVLLSKWKLTPGTQKEFELKFPRGACLPVNEQAAGSLKRKAKLPARYWVLHPGMSGSAENLSVSAYAEAARRLQARFKDLELVLSLGPGPRDGAFASLASQLSALKVDGLSLSEFAELLRGAHHVLAPSTGPLHLAHWVGATTYGVYSPVRAHRSQRWAPYGGCGVSRVWTPKVSCPATRHCRGASCPEYYCMEKSQQSLVNFLEQDSTKQRL